MLSKGEFPLGEFFYNKPAETYTKTIHDLLYFWKHALDYDNDIITLLVEDMFLIGVIFKLRKRGCV